ncbi:MAG: serine hydrolase domain-containing protein [Gaiellaceae bacterium]
MIGGQVASGFEEVRREFARNFERRRELGAACAAYVEGVKVVDLWGGRRHFRKPDPWQEDTLVMVYSTSKGMAAMAVALAQSRGLLDYDELVASYWPEFAQNGKEAITVRQLLAHQAGLCGIDEPLDANILADFDALADVLAKQRPAWEPGTRYGYHALSIGWYEGELIRRVDPERRTLGRFFAEEIAGPLGLELYFGLPDDVPAERVARIKDESPIQMLLRPTALPPGMMLGFARKRSLTYRSFVNPRSRGTSDLDRPEYRAVEIPSAGGIAQVRSIARAYSELATGGAELGFRPETLEEISAPPRPPSKGDRDLVLTVPTAYSLGWVRPTSKFRFGSSDRAFGHPGAGGSFGFADPDRGVSFAYAMNRHGHYLNNDPREKALRDALYRCLARGAGSGEGLPEQVSVLGD